MADRKTDPSESVIQALKEAIYAAKTASLADCVVVVHPLHDLPPDPGVMFAIGTTKDRMGLMVYVCMKGLQHIVDDISNFVQKEGNDTQRESLRTMVDSLNSFTQAMNTFPLEDKELVVKTVKPEIIN